ncbi:MAG: hypothetical protein PHR26_01660 [Candidatus ainarchaeum sp.]|nr:hypothetical protein [Candidatus ainarchaeum sp.]MDD3975874.1 hypothetical protein [Candidatus ainarchaeum sp.]
MNKKINLKLIIIFIISYAFSQILIKILSPTNFFTSPMYILLPIVGFGGMYYLTPTIMKYINLKNKYYFSIIFFIIGILCFLIATFFFYWNSLKILNNMPIKYPFFKILLDSAYLELIISGIFGILSNK